MPDERGGIFFPAFSFTSIRIEEKAEPHGLPARSLYPGCSSPAGRSEGKAVNAALLGAGERPGQGGK